MDNMSLSDIAAVTRNVDGDGWGAGGGWIMIILFALIFGGNGLWGNNNRKPTCVMQTVFPSLRTRLGVCLTRWGT